VFLYEGQIGNKYRVIDIGIDYKLKRRLEVIGFTYRTEVEVLNKNLNGSLILKVRGTRFAISKMIAKKIEVICNG